MTLGVLIHGVVPVDILHAVLGSENPHRSVGGTGRYAGLCQPQRNAADRSGPLEQGIAIGIVLAFVIGGAGVSIPNLILLNKLFKRWLLLVYASTVVTVGIIVGSMFNVCLI